MTGGLSALLLAGTAPQWIPVGVSGSRLRVFVDRRSIERAGGLVAATVRIGSPAAIAGRIVVVYQHEQFDCPGRRWRLLSYEGVDAAGTIVSRRGRATPPPPFLPVQPDSIGETTLDTVCFIARATG